MDEADKKQISTLLQSGRSNSEIAYWLSRAYSGEIETLNLETGDIADYRTTAQGMELEVMDAEEKRLAMLYFRWDEVAPLLRGMYARQQDGFGQEQPQPATEFPTFHSETMAVYPAIRTICLMMWWWNGCILRSRSRQPCNRAGENL